MRRLLGELSRANYLVALTGAGMDTESNLPDFRGPDGLWRHHDPRQLASTDSLRGNYPLFREFYAHRIRGLMQVRPHKGHSVLAQWEAQGFLKAIVTQNVSGLHQAAGSVRVLELHGNLRRIYCQDCGAASDIDDFLDGHSCRCGGKLRPGVTLFGEMLPADAFRQAVEELSKADFLLILGTSLEVYPAAQLPFLYPMKRCYVDLEAAHPQRMDYVFREKIGGFLARAQQGIAREKERNRLL